MPLSSQPSPSWIVLPAVTVGALTLGCMALLALGADQVGFPLSAVCSLAVVVAAHRRARSTLRSDADAAFGMAAAAAGMAPFLVAGIYTGHVRPLWVESLPDVHARKLWIEGIPMLASAGVLATVLFAESLAAAVDRPRHRRALRGALRALSALVAVVALWGLGRGLVRPVLDPLPHGLPVVAALPAPNYLDPIQDHPLGPVVLTAACPAMHPDAHPCWVVMRRRESDPYPRGWSVDGRLPGEATQMRESSFSSDAALEVLRDARHDLWIVRELREGRRRPFAAFRGGDLARVDVRMSDYATEYAPPRGWCVAALLGVALAWWMVRRGPRIEPAPTRGAMDAMPIGDSALRLVDGTTVAAPTDVVLPTSPVVVVSVGEGDAPYRAATTVRVLAEGTLQGWRELNDAEGDLYAVLALATLVLAGTPLATGVWLGLWG